MRASCLGPGDFLPFPLRFLQEITNTTEPTVLWLPWDAEFNFSSLLYALIEKFMAGHSGGRQAAGLPMVHWARLMAFTLLESPVFESQERLSEMRRFYPMWRATSLRVHRSEIRA